MNRILEIYSRRMMEEPLDLREFLNELMNGVHGNFSRAEILEFLELLRDRIISNIHLKASEDPRFSQDAKRVVKETEDFIDSLKEILDEN
jgi:hypothetical protein